MFKNLTAWFGRTTMGGTIEYSPGAIVSHRGLLKESIKVQSYRRRRDDLPMVRLELVATSLLSYQSHPAEIRLNDARELVRLLDEAIRHFETSETQNA
jgi:hypothetical protein